MKKWENVEIYQMRHLTVIVNLIVQIDKVMVCQKVVLNLLKFLIHKVME